MRVWTAACLSVFVVSAAGSARSAPPSPAITNVTASRDCLADVGTSDHKFSNVLGQQQFDCSGNTGGKTATSKSDTTVDVTADSITFSGMADAALDLPNGSPGSLYQVWSRNSVSFTTTVLTSYALTADVANPPNAVPGHSNAFCSFTSGPSVGFGSAGHMSGSVGGLLPPGTYGFESFLGIGWNTSGAYAQTASFSNFSLRATRAAPPTFRGSCVNATGTSRPDLKGSAFLTIDTTGDVAGEVDVGTDKLPFSGRLTPNGTFVQTPKLTPFFTLTRTAMPDLRLTLAVQSPGTSVTGTLVETGTNATSNVTLTGGIQPALLRGAIVDSTSAAKDSLSLSWRFAKSGKTFDPRAAATSFEFGDPASPVHVDIPANDAAWKGKKGKWTWSTAKGAVPAYKLVLDGVKGSYTLSASKIDLAASPATTFHTAVSDGTSSVAQTVVFDAHSRGRFTYKP